MVKCCVKSLNKICDYMCARPYGRNVGSSMELVLDFFKVRGYVTRVIVRITSLMYKYAMFDNDINYL